MLHTKRLTTQDLEFEMERLFTGKQMSLEWIDRTMKTGKLQRLALNNSSGELMVTLIIDRQRYEVDIKYFSTYTIFYDGGTPRTGAEYIRRIYQKD